MFREYPDRLPLSVHRERMTTMKKTLVAASVLAALAAAYVGTAHHVGTVIAQEVAGYETALAALDDVRVHRMSYERRLFDGVLHYDVELRPLPGSVLHELVAEFSDEAPPGVRIQGSSAVRHGPWVGGGDGVALARSEHAVPLPEGLRDMLPQYPGQRPLLEGVAVLGLDRTLALRLRGIDYRGKLAPAPDEPVADLVLAGLAGRMAVGAGARAIDAEFRLDELSVASSGSDAARAAVRGIAVAGDLKRIGEGLWTGPASLAVRELALSAEKDGFTLAGIELRTAARTAAGRDGAPRQALKADGAIGSLRFETSGTQAASVEAGKLAFDMDAVSEWPTIWVGDAGARLDRLAASAQGSRLEAAALALSSRTRLAGEAIDQTLALGIGPVSIDGVGIAGGQLDFSIKGLAAAPLDELLAAIERQTQAGVFVPDAEFEQTLRSVGARLLAGKVSAGFDRIALGVDGPDDATARLVVSFAGEPGVDLDDPVQLLGRLEAQAGIAVRTAALRSLAAALVEAEWRGEVRSGQPVPDAASRAAEAEARYEQLIAAAREIPFLVVSADAVRAEASWAAGKLSVNGVESDADAGLLALGALAALFSDGDGAIAAKPNLEAAPMFGAVKLTADFAPDPYRVDLMAGGSAALDATLGEDCVGRIDADQPDLALDYQAGEYKLFIYGEADDDISLAIHAPDGNWYCNDDGPARGLNPTVAFARPSSGTYRIWVGTIAHDATPARLMISEMDPAK